MSLARTRLTVLAALPATLAATPAGAQSQTDFDACNQIAAARVGARASPAPGGAVASSSPGASVGGAVMTAPGSSDVNRVPNASGRIAPAGQSDPVYQQAYGDCLRSRGF